MTTDRNQLIEWVVSRILPHERDVRARLYKLGSRSHEVDDIIQDTYLQIARLDSVDHIRDSRAYLMAAARSALRQRVRRERIVRIEQLTDSITMTTADETPDPERRAQAREELDRIVGLINELPPRCRQVFELRRIEGISQRDIAARLGISEGMVEQEAIRGLRLLQKAVTASEEASSNRKSHATFFRRSRGLS